MSTRLLFILFLLFTSVSSFAQLHDNDYRNSKNPMYWQNRKPDGAYWQQDVEYKINATIHTDDNRISAMEKLTYWNNSPDTLHYVYFHLFQNAFIKGSHLHELEKANKVKPHLGKMEEALMGTNINNLRVDDLQAEAEIDNTIMKVYLPKPLYPGGHAVFTMLFDTYYDRGGTRRRMQMWQSWGFTHYNGVQWFPKMCVYDRKFGWDTYQHLNKEFYGDFGSYDVTLDFPENYIVEATGELVNKKECLPDTLLQKLDIKNFAHKKWNEAPSTVVFERPGQRKQWHYKAINVHDFAFTADPSYRIGITYWNGIQCEALVQEPHAAGWQNGAEYVAKIIKTFSEDVGMYQYPKMVAADAQDGMEYPMLTLDGGSDPGYRSLLTHEIGHNWFYGMVGNNETYRAALDEGFTQFLTSWGLRRIDGDTEVQAMPKSKYRRHFWEPTLVMDRNVLNAYTYDALNQNELPLNTHSDDFNNALNHNGGYREVYFKTASMLYNLQYTLGDSLFSSALKHYFSQWRFAHPYFEDFRNSIIDYTHVDLNWFFDEWLETTKTLDYKIGKIKRLNGTDSFAIHFHRLGEMQMPVDFTVTAKDGKKYSYNIPNTWFTKKTEATVLPKWYGWGKLLYPDYTAHVQIPSGVHSVQIDTTYRFADKNMVNNYKTRGLPISPEAIHTKLDGGLTQQYDRRKYRMYIRPDLWWNPVDGIKVGAHFEGDYLYSLYKIDASIWYNTHLLQQDQYKTIEGQPLYNNYLPVNYSVNYTSPITVNMPKLQLQLNSRLLDGLWYHRGGFNWLISDNNTVQLYAQTMWRPNVYALDYLIYPTEWSSAPANPNSSLNAAWTHHYNYVNGNGAYTFSFRAPFLTNSFNYSYAQLEAINNNRIAKLDVRTRIFGRYGLGDALPYESELFAAGANPEQMMEDKYTRTIGFEPEDWHDISGTDINHFQAGGGLDLRGYVGYLMPETKNGMVLAAYKGRSGAAANVEVDVDNYIPLHPRITRNWLHTDLYAFADAGVMELSTFNTLDYTALQPTDIWSNIRVDAGVGVAFTIKRWGIFEKARPLTLRFDVPFFLNHTPYASPDYFAFRYVIGINRAF